MKLNLWVTIETFDAYNTGKSTNMLCYSYARYDPERMVQVEFDLNVYKVEVIAGMFRVARRVYPKPSNPRSSYITTFYC